MKGAVDDAEFHTRKDADKSVRAPTRKRKWSERQDSNLRRLAPKASALARLSYAPIPKSLKGIAANTRCKGYEFTGTTSIKTLPSPTFERTLRPDFISLASSYA